MLLIIFLTQADVLETLESSWTKIKQQDESEVRVVMGVATSDTPTVEVLKWCVCEGMELVEWERGENPQPQDTGRNTCINNETVLFDLNLYHVVKVIAV